MSVTQEAPSAGGHEPPGAAAPTATPSRRVAALDGLRGFALVGMLLWHAEVQWVQGGFARMTIFFALSGYLATRSWSRIRARRAAGEPASGFREFWWRRARRLLPVSFLGIGVAVAVTALVGTGSMRARVGGDVLSVLAYVSNVRFWRSDQSYGELFTEPSLLQHYWTLSIEEQAFFVLPLLLAGVAVLTRGRTRVAAAAVTVLAAACAGFPAVVEHTPDAVWYSSIVRFGEFCGGVALALWTADRAAEPPRRPRLLAATGTVALVAMATIMVTIPRDAEWLYRGGMALVIVPTVALLAAAARSAGPAATVLGLAPLRLLGTWTFSIYVLHWPLFWVVDGARTGLDGWQLASVRLAAAVALGAVVHVLVERPLMASGPVARAGTGLAGAVTRRDRVDRRLASLVPSGWWRTRPAAASLAVAGVALAAVSALPSGDEHAGYDFESVASEDWVETAHVKMFDPDTRGVPVALFGGSTSLMLNLGAEGWTRRSDLVALRPGVTPLGCGLVNEGARLVHDPGSVAGTASYPPAPVCAASDRLWPEVARIGQPDVALVVVGVWDTGDFVIDGIGRTRIGDDPFDELLRRNLERARADFLEAGVTQVQLTTTPAIRRGEGGRLWEERGLDETHPERVAAFNALLAEFADDHHDVELLDYAGWVASLPDDEVREVLPDGVHPTEESAARIWEEFLAPAVAGAYRDV